MSLMLYKRGIGRRDEVQGDQLNKAVIFGAFSSLLSSLRYSTRYTLYKLR